MKRFWQKEKGFTLIELLIVVAIIGIVAGIAIPRFLGARTVARVTRAFADMRTIADGLEMYFIAENVYPDALDDLTTSTPAYMTSIPDDVFGDEDDARAGALGYFVNDADTPTMWLIVSNGPDGDPDVTGDDVDFESDPVSGELGGSNGATGDHYFTASGDLEWSVAKSATDNGDIGRGGP